MKRFSAKLTRMTLEIMFVSNKLDSFGNTDFVTSVVGPHMYSNSKKLMNESVVACTLFLAQSKQDADNALIGDQFGILNNSM